MKIIIAKSFEKEFKKIFKWEIKIKNFSLQLKRKEFINLEYPLKKYKFNFSWISIRGIVSVEIEWYYIPIFIVKKSNKQYWMNLIIDSDFFKIIMLRYKKIDTEIKKWEFSEF